MIGIIGGGAAGLASAWLLEHEHDVTLFEKDDRLGGHAHTVEIEAHGQRLASTPGSSSSARARPTRRSTVCSTSSKCRAQSYPATLTVFHAARSASRRHAAAARRPAGLGVAHPPRRCGTLIRFRRFLADGAGVPRDSTTRTVTIAEYLEQQRLPRWFVDGFLLPAAAVVLVRRASRVPAVRRLQRAVLPRREHADRARAARQSEIAGGMKVYVDALVASARPHDASGSDSPIQRVTPRRATATSVKDADGERHDVRSGRHRDERAAGAATCSSRSPSSRRGVAQLRRFRVLRHDDRDPRRSAPHAPERVGVVGRQCAVGRCAQLAVDLEPRARAAGLQELGHVRRAPARAAVRLATYEHGMIDARLLRRPAPAEGAAGRARPVARRALQPTTPTRTRARSARPSTSRSDSRPRPLAWAGSRQPNRRARPRGYGVAPGRGRRTSR